MEPCASNREEIRIPVLGLAVSLAVLCGLAILADVVLGKVVDDPIRRRTYLGVVGVVLVTIGIWVAIRCTFASLLKPIGMVESLCVFAACLVLLVMVLVDALHAYSEYREAAWTLGKAHAEETIMLNPESLVPFKKDRDLFVEWVGRGKILRP